MKKPLSVVAVSALLIAFCGYAPVGAFQSEPPELVMLYAQQTEEFADKQSETPRDEVLNEAETEEEDEYDEYEDEYADEEDVELIPDPLIGVNTGLYHFNDKLYFWLLKPVARVYGFIIPEEFRSVIRNVFYNNRFPAGLLIINH